MTGKRAALPALICLGLLACSEGGRDSGFMLDGNGRAAFDGRQETFEGPVPPAECGPGSNPEPGLQGQVSAEVRAAGGFDEARNCNLELAGQFQGTGAGWQFDWYDDCGYYGTAYLGDTNNPGVQVVDVSDPAKPSRSTNLPTPAMLDPWESVKINEPRELLGAVASWNILGPLFIDVYDVSDDCRQPQLLASAPMQIPVAHAGDFAQDGMTYYGAFTVSNGVAAIDLSDPALPLYLGNVDFTTHDLSSSADGTRLYMANNAGNGLDILDITPFQNREPAPEATLVSSLYWDDGAGAQDTLPVTINGKPHLIFSDESGEGATRIIDISDETQPFIVSKLKLDVHMPENDAAVAEDCANETFFCYEGHYCGVDRVNEPTIVACGYFNSGIRVFDIRDPYQPREIAYFNPPGQDHKRGELSGSQHDNGVLGGRAPVVDLTADWCSAQVRVVTDPPQLWTTCQDNGFMVLEFTNGVWPFPEED